MSNENLRLARQVKNDEFYTRYEDIEKELIRYKDQFKGKIVYCNCDAPESNFIKFFNDVQAEWQIKEVLHTSLKEGISYDSPKALELLDKCDIVVTNPPFSKVRNEFLPLIEKSGKQFLFIGNLNMATFKEVFPLIRDGKLWTGYTHPKEFLQPDGMYKKFGNTLWWTNMFVDKPFALNPDKKYYGNEDKYPRYDNYDAINVDKLADIPSDYEGVMGVPITFLDKYNPEQFEIIELGNGRDNFTPTKDYINPKMYKNGIESNGNAINRVLVYTIDSIPSKGVYYKADNCDKLLFAPYARVCIRCK